jgi:molybdopterin adenylyltransferase
MRTDGGAAAASKGGEGRQLDSSTTRFPLLAKVLTVSTSVAAGRGADSSGPALVERLASSDFEVVETLVVPDGRDSVADALRSLCEDFNGLVLTTGGTGMAPSDQTPEGTLDVLERQAPGLSEAMRAVNPLGRLSRGVAGTVGRALVINLPGSPSGALECLDAVSDVLPHAIELLAGRPAGHHR